LILDNCSSCCGGAFTTLCVQHRIVALSLHTPLTSFKLSICPSSGLRNVCGRGRTRWRNSMFAGVANSFMSAAVPHNIIQTFPGAGISLVVDQRSILCGIDAKEIRSR
jgi:hypothetical protein